MYCNHVICSQWHPLANPVMDCAKMNIPRVDYTRLETDLLFCQLCRTAVHEAKWLASIKKARPSLAKPS